MKQRSISLPKYLLQGINPVIRILIISDVLLVGSAGLLGPIFALFVEDFIVGGGAAVAGIAAAVFLLTKSIAQIPVAILLDKIRGEKDDFWFLVVFTFIMSLLPLSYLYINTPAQLYGVQAIFGLATAFTYPSFMTIFTRHIDAHKEGVEWGIYFTLTDLVSAAFAAIGGLLAEVVGFRSVIVIVVIVSVVGSMLLWPLKALLIMPKHTKKHKKRRRKK